MLPKQRGHATLQRSSCSLAATVAMCLGLLNVGWQMDVDGSSMEIPWQTNMRKILSDVLHMQTLNY